MSLASPLGPFGKPLATTPFEKRRGLTCAVFDNLIVTERGLIWAVQLLPKIYAVIRVKDLNLSFPAIDVDGYEYFSIFGIRRAINLNKLVCLHWILPQGIDDSAREGLLLGWFESMGDNTLNHFKSFSPVIAASRKAHLELRHDTAFDGNLFGNEACFFERIACIERSPLPFEKTEKKARTAAPGTVLGKPKSRLTSRRAKKHGACLRCRNVLRSKLVFSLTVVGVVDNTLFARFTRHSFYEHNVPIIALDAFDPQETLIGDLNDSLIAPRLGPFLENVRKALAAQV